MKISTVILLIIFVVVLYNQWKEFFRFNEEKKRMNYYILGGDIGVLSRYVNFFLVCFL